MKEFLDEMIHATSRNASHDDLIGVVRRHKEDGLSQECAYALLELIWLRLGCNKIDFLPNCDLLEGVMERVWSCCPPARALWSDSLDDKRMAEFRGFPDLEAEMLRAHRANTPEALRTCTLAILNRRFPGQGPPDLANQVNSQTDASVLSDWLLMATHELTVEDIAAYIRR